MLKGAQYIVDSTGRRTAVVIPIEAYEDLLEDWHLGQASRESKNEERIPWDPVRAQLVAEGRLAP